MGLSAWSYIKNRRFGNTKNIYDYIKTLEEGRLSVIYEERLTDEDRLLEKIMLGLRTIKGVPLESIPNKEYTKELVDGGFGTIDDGRFVLTPQGLMVINQIVSKLVS